MSDAPDGGRRRTIRLLSGLAVAGSLAAVAGCADEGPGNESDDDQADHPDEVGDSNGGGGGPIDEQNETGGAPDEGNRTGDAPDEQNETDGSAGSVEAGPTRRPGRAKQ